MAEIRIFDAGGRLVRRLKDEAEPGGNTVVWDGRSGQGRRLPSGVYFCQLKVGNYTSHKKMLLAD